MYTYGLQQVCMNLVNTIVLMIMGIYMQMLFETVIFVISFKAFRKYAGGYHSKTWLGCFALTNAVVLVVLSVMKYLRVNISIYLGLYLMSVLIIFMFAPVETENKKLDSIERVICTNRAIIVLIVQSTIVGVLLIFKWYVISKCIILGGIALCCSMIFGMLNTYLN